MSQPETARTRIEKEARKQFFTKGYTAVSMAEIARELGMSKKTLYQHFTSKEELLIAGIADYKKELNDGLDAILINDTTDFPDKTGQMFSHISMMLGQINPVLLEDIKKHAPQFWLQLEKANAETSYITFSRLLEDGISKGFIRGDVNKHLATLLYIVIIDSMLNPEFVQKIPDELQQEITFYPRILFDGLIDIMMKGIINK